MKILTIIRRVPDSMASIRIAEDGRRVETSGLKFVLNPFDEFAVEQALRIRESGAAVEEVVVLMPGPAEATDTMRTALAMGADRGVHIVTEEALPIDEVRAARLLSAAIKEKAGGPFDLILIGKRAIDLDSDALGPMTAEFLGLPHVAAVVAFELASDGASCTVRRRVEGAEETAACPFPALLTVEKGLCEPRYPTLPNIMKAKRKPLATEPAAALESGKEEDKAKLISLSPPPQRTACRFIEGEPAEQAVKLAAVLRDEIGVL